MANITIEELLQLAEQVRTNAAAGSNTNELVGSTLRGIVEKLQSLDSMSGVSAESVKFTPQTLTDEQKETVQANIGLGTLFSQKTSFSPTEIIDGKYLYSTDGETVQVADNALFCYSQPFYVCAGSTIKIKCAGYQQRLTVISEYDGGYQSLVQSIDSNVREYAYTVQQNMYVCISFKTGTFESLVISNDVVRGIESLDGEMKDLQEDVGKSVKNVTTSVSTSSAVAGTAIRNDGTTTANNSFSVISSLQLHAGDTLVMTAKGWTGAGGVSLAMVSEQRGTIYTCLLAATDSEVETYTYVAQESMIIALCYNNSVTPTISITSDVAQQVNELAESIGKDETHDAFTPLGNLFPNIAVIGDSLASGQTENPSSGTPYGDIYGSSWLSCLARGWNCTARNHYSTAGITCKNWLDGSGFPAAAGLRTKFESDPAFAAYFIALGTNDCSKKPYNFGNISDAAGTDSFVGYYKQIIELVRTHAPNCVIFCVSLYTTTYQTINYSDYSAMIAEIATLYDNVFYIDFIGHTEHKNNDNDGVYSIKSHYGTMGYQYVSKIINSLVNDVVKTNTAFFKTFGVNNSDGGQYSI